MIEPWQTFFLFLVMAAIQDDQQHVSVEDWPRAVWFLFQVSMFTDRAMPAIFPISDMVDIQDGEQHDY